MLANVTQMLKAEHQLILRMITLVEQNNEQMEAGSYRDWPFYLDAVDFIRNYADGFHHAKEEDVLFVELVENGMPAKRSPIEAMLMEHDQGREFVRRMEEAAQRLFNGEDGLEAELATAARGYASLLREHISKEDKILYPLAERILPDSVRGRMQSAYAVAAEHMPGLDVHYRHMVEKYETKSKSSCA